MFCYYNLLEIILTILLAFKFKECYLGSLTSNTRIEAVEPIHTCLTWFSLFTSFFLSVYEFKWYFVNLTFAHFHYSNLYDYLIEDSI